MANISSNLKIWKLHVKFSSKTQNDSYNWLWQPRRRCLFWYLTVELLLHNLIRRAWQQGESTAGCGLWPKWNIRCSGFLHPRSKKICYAKRLFPISWNQILQNMNGYFFTKEFSPWFQYHRSKSIGKGVPIHVHNVRICSRQISLFSSTS